MDDYSVLEINARRLERQLAEAKMTLRDQFAMAALSRPEGSPLGVARQCYEIADAMMEARKKIPGGSAG